MGPLPARNICVCFNMEIQGEIKHSTFSNFRTLRAWNANANVFMGDKASISHASFPYTSRASQPSKPNQGRGIKTRGKARKSVTETEQENGEKMRKRGWEASGEVWMWAAAFRGGGEPAPAMLAPGPLPAYRCINHSDLVEGILPAPSISAEIKACCKPRDISNATFD